MIWLAPMDLQLFVHFNNWVTCILMFDYGQHFQLLGLTADTASSTLADQRFQGEYVLALGSSIEQQQFKPLIL